MYKFVNLVLTQDKQLETVDVVSRISKDIGAQEFETVAIYDAVKLKEGLIPKTVFKRMR